MKNPSQAITALSSLIDINDKRTRTYRSLAERTPQEELRLLFSQLASQSNHFSKSLSTWRAAYGGFALSQKKSGITNAWTQIKSLFGSTLGRDIMSQCKNIEQDSLKAYKTAIESSVLPTAAVADVERQIKELEKALATLSVLRAP